MTNMSTTMLQALTDKMSAVRDEMKEQARAAFEAAFKGLFDEHPAVVAFHWQQYTPYFCDGDPCEFSGPYEIEARFTDTAEDAGDDEDGYESIRHTDYFKTPAGKKLDRDLAALAKVEDDLYLLAFGDHVEVTVTREGIETEEYSHA